MIRDIHLLSGTEEESVMENGKLLSIVIPAYNVEKYIRKCLDSFLEESVLPELEILVINDGSTDATPEIVSEYADRYPDSIRLISKENGGHGSAINRGVEEAQGSYFKVVDGDDWVDTRLLPEFVRMLKSTDSDIVSNDFNLIEDETWKLKNRRKAVKNSYHYDREWGFAEAVNEPGITIHSMTVKTSVMKANPTKLDEHCFYEDQEYILYPIPYASSITFSSIALYQYRIGRKGQSVDVSMMVKRHDQHLRVMESLLEYLDLHREKLPLYKQQYMDMLIAEAADDEYRIFLAKGNSRENREDMKAFDDRIRRQYPGVYLACSRKSVWLIRQSNYRIFGLGCLVYRIVR